MRLAFREIRLSPLRFRYINSETTGIDKFPIFESHAGRDEDVADRAVFRSQPRRVFVEFFASFESPEDVRNGRGVGMEIADIATDAIAGLVAHHGEFGFIGPKDRAVPADEVEAYCPIFKEIFEIVRTGNPALRLLKEWH